MTKLLYKFLIFIGFVFSIFTFIVFYYGVTGYKENPILPEEYSFDGVAFNLFVSILFTCFALLLYTIANVIVVIKNLKTSKNNLVLPIISTLLSIILVILMINMSELRENFYTIVIYQVAHLIVIILQIIMLIKYCKGNNKAIARLPYF